MNHMVVTLLAYEQCPVVNGCDPSTVRFPFHIGTLKITNMAAKRGHVR